MSEGLVVMTMTFWQAVSLLSAPIVVVLFWRFTRWADEQRQIEAWWERYRKARR